MTETSNVVKPHRGKMFRDLRRRQGLSLQALGAAVGVDPSTISRWEARKDFVQFARFVMALHRLGMTPEVFLALDPPKQLEALPAPGPTVPAPSPTVSSVREPGNGNGQSYGHAATTNRLERWGV